MQAQGFLGTSRAFCTISSPAMRSSRVALKLLIQFLNVFFFSIFFYFFYSFSQTKPCSRLYRRLRVNNLWEEYINCQDIITIERICLKERSPPEPICKILKLITRRLPLWCAKIKIFWVGRNKIVKYHRAANVPDQTICKRRALGPFNFFAIK